MTLPFVPDPAASYAWVGSNVYSHPYRYDAVPGGTSIAGGQVANVVKALGLKVVDGEVPQLHREGSVRDVDTYIARSPFVDGYWLPVTDGDRRALALYKRHYTYREYKDGRNRTIFVGPGQKMVLLTFQCDALFVWRKFISLDHQEGVNCAVFRNEGPILSSELIREAMGMAWRRWPGERLYTYVNADKVASKGNPGCCFKKAGWRKCGVSQKGLIIFEALQ